MHYLLKYISILDDENLQKLRKKYNNVWMLIRTNLYDLNPLLPSFLRVTMDLAGNNGNYTPIKPTHYELKNV